MLKNEDLITKRMTIPKLSLFVLMKTTNEGFMHKGEIFLA